MDNPLDIEAIKLKLDLEPWNVSWECQILDLIEELDATRAERDELSLDNNLLHNVADGLLARANHAEAAIARAEAWLDHAPMYIGAYDRATLRAALRGDHG